MKTLLTRVFGRLTGARGEAGGYGVTRAETSFGGGKTHSLIAVCHLARGERPGNLSEFIDPALMPDCPVQIAGIVGDALDPVNGLETNGRLALTLRGEMGAQLGEHAFEILAASDAARTAPGNEISELLDELAGTYSETVRETHSVLERAGRPIKPAETTRSARSLNGGSSVASTPLLRALRGTPTGTCTKA